MKFGSLRQRSGQTRRPRPRQRSGLPRLHRIQRRGRGARLRQHLRGRAPFHRLRPGVGEPQPADLGRGAHQDAAARHRGDGAALAQSGAAGRAGRDHRSALRRPARIRRRQGLPPQRVRQLLHPDGGGRRALRGVPCARSSSRGPPRSASRTTASTGTSRTSSSSRRPQQKPHPPIWMAAGSPDSIRKVARRGSKLLLDQFASTRSTIERFNIYKAEVEACGPQVRSDGRRVCRAPSMSRKNAADKAKAIEARLAQPAAAGQACADARTATIKSSCCRSTDTLEAAAESAMFGTPDEIAREARSAARRPASSTCCSTARPDRARICAASRAR